MSSIAYFTHNEIDKEKWDACMDASSQSLIYGYSWYLDCLTEGKWDGIVVGDYEAVFPLPTRKKFGIHYIYQPFFCQQLGLFSAGNESIKLNDIIAAIPSKFKKIHLQLNPSCIDPATSLWKRNYILDLSPSYEEISAKYNRDARQNLKKINKIPVQIRQTLDFETPIALHRKSWGVLDKKIETKDYDNFAKACAAAKEKDQLYCVEAVLQNETIGAAIFIQSTQRLHYLVSGPTALGRQYSIMHGIIDFAIKTHAKQNKLLDFEGSEIPEVALFYEKWGSEIEKYQIFLNKTYFFL